LEDLVGNTLWRWATIGEIVLDTKIILWACNLLFDARNTFGAQLTSGVVRGSQENTTSRLAFADDVRSSWSTENAILADKKLLDAVSGSNLCNELHNLWVPVSAVTANDEEASLDALGDGEEDTGDEGFTIVRLLEDDDLLSKTRTNQ
jgi:hypothetical protein